jgi:hypothetical protein
MRRLVTIVALLLIFTPAAHAVCGLPDNPQWTQAPPYDPTVLEKTYDCLSAGYNPAKRPDYKYDLVLPMEYAGVDELMKDDGGLPGAERAHILNDFGFWLQKEGDISYAIRVLHKSVQISPQRALTWLNLGDEYTAALTSTGQTSCCVFTVPPADIPSLTSQASAAYHRYAELTPHPVAHALAFLAQHPYDPANEAVCRDIAEHANTGDLPTLFLPPGAPIYLPSSSQTYYVYTLIDQPEGESLMAYTSPQRHPGASPGTPIDFSPLSTDDELEGRYRRLEVIPYAGSIAILSIAYGYDNMETESIRAVLPGRHVVCDVDQISNLVLTTSQNKRLCAVFRGGHYFQQPLVDTSRAGQRIMMALGPGGNYVLAGLAGTARADLQNNGQLLDLAFFSYSNTTDRPPLLPPDCHQSGVVIFDPTTTTVLTSNLNNKLMHLPPFCPESADTLITWQGKTYIETGIPGKMTVPGAGIYTVKDDNIIPICLIGDGRIYSAD